MVDWALKSRKVGRQCELRKGVMVDGLKRGSKEGVGLEYGLDHSVKEVGRTKREGRGKVVSQGLAVREQSQQTRRLGHARASKML